jgi:cystathionine beta-lyase/cystathionine gamma-synthase
MDCWLALRGTKTLELRMERHNRSAQRIAEWLEARSDITAVYYPGLPSHPQHELAKRQMRGFGGMISFDLGDVPRARRVVEKVKLFILAESLGGVESLVCHPVSMTHGSIPKEQRDRLGVTEGLVRLSCGIEDVDDLLEDLASALR